MASERAQSSFISSYFTVMSAFLFVLALVVPISANAQVTAFKQAVAEAAANDRDVATFYQNTGYQSLWTGDGVDHERRKLLVRALQDAPMHGLPASRYDLSGVMDTLRTAKTPRDLGFAEVKLSKVYAKLARDMQSGILQPQAVVSAIKREVVYRDRIQILTDLSQRAPREAFRSLAPQSNEYKRLMKEKMRLEALIAQGGWGERIASSSLKPGATGASVVAMRNRLFSMGYLPRTATQSYDARMQKAVQSFQLNHGLEATGIAGESTIKELNVSAAARLKAVMVAMERERWLNSPEGKGQRHILVNLTDFSARIMDNDEETFRTRAVIGARKNGRESPEFSDEMEHMVINPTWHVPRSIAVKEYLPQMKRNRNAAGHLKLYDSRGRAVSRSKINFGAYNARNFPYAIKQPPSSRNALGLVKFMFPNKYNIYLHDTPAKNLFAHETRAYSHGCIRLAQPFDFAYEILTPQEDDPKAAFHRTLDTGKETYVHLDTHVPVHIVYRTAFTNAKGHTNYRRDIYGRDAQIWSALQQAGVSLLGVQG